MTTDIRSVHRLTLALLLFLAVAVVFTFATYQQAAAQTEEAANPTDSGDEILELDCYEENLTRMIHLEVNITEKSVIEPKDIRWAGIGRPSQPDSNSDLSLGTIGADGYPLTIRIFRISREMRICRFGYPGEGCELFTCYKPSVPLF